MTVIGAPVIVMSEWAKRRDAAREKLQRAHRYGIALVVGLVLLLAFREPILLARIVAVIAIFPVSLVAIGGAWLFRRMQ